MSFLPILPPLLLALVVVPALALTVWRLVRARGAATRTAWALRVALVVVCGLLALRPGLPDGSARTVAADVDVFVVVDSTTSVMAEDWGDGEPRIEGVRADVRALAEAYPGARFSLISSDNSATVRLPLTTDRGALAVSADVLTPPVTVYATGSSIAVAAPLLAETLERAAETSPDRARLVFYLGDGEQTIDAPPESFADSAEWVDGGGVLGYGTAEGGEMRRVTGVVGADDAGSRDDSYLQYQGEPARSVIDEQNLQAIADELGVAYQHRTAGDEPTFPPAPATTTTTDDDTASRAELSWVLGIAAAALLAALAGIDAGRIRRVRTSARPTGEGAS